MKSVKKLLLGALLFLAAVITLSATYHYEEDRGLREGFTLGDPEIASIDQMSFGPDGVLFLGDSKKAAIYALDTKDVQSNATVEDIRIEGFDKKIAASLGTTVDNIKISEMVVNPISKNIYFAVQVADGTPCPFKVERRGFRKCPFEGGKLFQNRIDRSGTR